MGGNESKQHRKDELLAYYPSIDDLTEKIYNKIDESEVYKHSQLFQLLGRVYYIYHKFQKESLFFHIEYVDNGKETAFNDFLVIARETNKELYEIEKNIDYY
jgi:hypothetical protein